MSHPIYYFKVNILTAPEMVSSVLPGTNREQLLYQLRNKTVLVSGVPRPLRHGDCFTLSGSEAIRVKNLYVNQGSQSPFVLEMFDIPNVENLALVQEESELTLTWTGNDSFYVVVEVTADDGGRITTQLNKGVNTFKFNGKIGRNVIRLKFTDGQGNVSREYATVSAVVTTQTGERFLVGEIFAATPNYDNDELLKNSLYRLVETDESYTPEFLTQINSSENDESATLACNTYNGWIYRFSLRGDD